MSLLLFETRRVIAGAPRPRNHKVAAGPHQRARGCPKRPKPLDTARSQPESGPPWKTSSSSSS
ncbi:hypothetical protein AIOL_000903 [Candidatus Rhodobacter oscarellae]|uniref:Uncharacterized protein n=1 Tax=Candidatus Rhodobacter oscarellae TaxID=1675527 RepID=A0A0J9H581_9RHOB|nr:hypothetical protein AIOL_000903 [Candidatus Rhodobacter lobularis]